MKQNSTAAQHREDNKSKVMLQICFIKIPLGKEIFHDDIPNYTERKWSFLIEE